MSYNFNTNEQQGSKEHSAPCSNRDYDFFYAGLEQGVLLVQKCDDCQALRNPPSPMCPECNSMRWSPMAMGGQGTLHSYVIHHYPPLEDFPSPHPIAVVALAEGPKLTAAMDGTAPDRLRIGMPVQIEFVRRGEMAGFRFKTA